MTEDRTGGESPPRAEPLAAATVPGAVVYLELSRTKVSWLLQHGLLPGRKQGSGLRAAWRIDLRPERRDWRSPAEAARELGLSRETIMMMVRQGTLASRRVAHDVRLIDAASVAERATEVRPAGDAAAVDPEEAARRAVAAQRYQRVLLRFLVRRGLSWEHAEDVVQEVMVQALAHPVDADPEVYRNRLYAHADSLRRSAQASTRRRDRRLGPIVSLTPEREPADRAPDPAEQVTDREGARAMGRSVRLALQRLSPTQRATAAALAAGLRPHEIAAREGVSRQAIFDRMAAIRCELEAHGVLDHLPDLQRRLREE